MDFLEATAGKNDADRRLDKIIRIYIPQMPLSEIYKLIRKGLIKINGKKTKAEYKVKENDVLSYPKFVLDNSIAPEVKDNLPPLSEIVFQNEHILILNKPYNMLVHGSKDSLDKIVNNYYEKNFKSDSISFKPGPLHRIDKKTTGLIAFSLSLAGAQWFSENIKNHEINKKYYGIIEGVLNQEEVWKDYILKDEQSLNNTFHTVNASNEKYDQKQKEAFTVVTPLAHGHYKNTDVTFVQFDIKTGRTHQIRSQSSLHKHPLLGDSAYGGKVYKEVKQEFYLQAYKLTIPQNDLGLPEVIEIKPSENFLKMLNLCGIKL